MRRSLWKGVLAAAVFLPALGGAAAQDQQGQDQQGQEQRGIIGVWDVSVTVVSCSTGAPQQPPLPHLGFLMFADGGTMTEISEGSTRSAGVGTWRHIGGSSYANREIYYGYSAFGPPANGTTIITREINLGKNADEYASYATSDFYDTNGNLINTVCATATATRFE